MKVTKRDGRLSDYSMGKLVKAVHNATMEVIDDETEAISIAESIASVTHLRIVEKYNQPTVEEIQDLIEQTLMDFKHYEIAKAFILYRQKHQLERDGAWIEGDLSESIWENKYRYKNETHEEFLNRVSDGNSEIAKLIRSKHFCPAGRILANRGLQRDGKKITYSNCYVIAPVEDNLESIFDSAYKLARTFSFGGGAGIDISKLRPAGSKVNNAAKTTSGATSFMQLFDVTSKIIGQQGRRAALIISLECSHPNIEQFIDIKNDLDAVTKANISIRITDDFLKAVKKDNNYELSFLINDTGEHITKIVNARKIFNKIALSNWRMAEPGMLFWNRIENWNLLSEDPTFKYAGVNPCSEEPLPAGGSCLLSAINLSEFIVHPFKANAYFDFDFFEKVVGEGIIYLNKVLDEGMRLHPLHEQRESVQQWRQIGLGIFGLADMFIKLRIKYANPDSIQIIKQIGKVLINTSLQQSALLAAKDGPYPRYHSEDILKSKFLKANATSKTLKLIMQHGLRNSQLTTIAPTGTISNLFGTSGGIEPIFALSYKRLTKTLHDEEKEYEVFTPIVREYMKQHGIEDINNLPDYFVTSHDIPYKNRIDLQSAFQKYIDAAISSTINLPNSATVSDVKDLYMYAWEKGLKGITIYRDGCARTGILTTNKNKEEKKEMTQDDFLEQNICPTCQNELNHTGGCVECPACGFSVCSV